MNRIVIFSDLHIHNYRRFNSPNSIHNLNTRMVKILHVLRDVLGYARLNKIEKVLFCGDFFHEGSSISTDILQSLGLEFRNLPADFLWLMPGQHDYDGKYADFNAAKALCNMNNINLVYMDDSVYDLFDDYVVLPVHYQYDVNLIKSNLNDMKDFKREGKKIILLGHFLVKEMLDEIGLSLDLDVVSYDDFPENIYVSLVGDLHTHIWLPDLRIMSVGEVCQHDFNSKTSGFIDMDLDTLEFKIVPVSHPKFITVTAKEFNPKKMKKENFHRVIVKDQQEVDRITAKTDSSWFIEFQYEGEEKKEIEDRITIDKEEPVDVMREYADYMGATQEIRQKGEEILNNI